MKLRSKICIIFRWIDREKCEPMDVYVKTWLDLGAKYVGGCCRTYAADVSRIRNEVTKWQHNRKYIHNNNHHDSQLQYLLYQLIDWIKIIKLLTLCAYFDDRYEKKMHWLNINKRLNFFDPKSIGMLFMYVIQQFFKFGGNCYNKRKINQIGAIGHHAVMQVQN